MLQFWAEVVPQLCANIVSALVALKVRTIVFRLSTTIAANAGCYAQIYVHCYLEMTKQQQENALRPVLQAPPHLYGALCVFTYSS